MRTRSWKREGGNMKIQCIQLKEAIKKHGKDKRQNLVEF